MVDQSSEPFDLAVEDRDGHLLITPAGELDMASAPELEQLVLPAINGGRHVVLDLRVLDFMDSSGVRVLVAAHATAQDGDGQLTIVRPPDGSAVSRVLEVSGVDQALRLVDEPGTL